MNAEKDTLKEVTVVGSYDGKVADYAFFGKENIENVEVKKGVHFIGCRAFMGCKNLTHITIPDSVTCIGIEAFRFCSKLKTIIIPQI